ncbi:FAD-dependent oxidoreductase [Actinomadura graeca]|nr:FAD-dependent oxidoreductase [Actinomadura graeca]
MTETLDLYGAFPRLSEAQLTELSPHGEHRAVLPGHVLFREGEPTTEFIVVLAGKVAMVEGHGPDEQTIAVHGPRRFLGELSLLTGQAGFLTAVVREPGEVLAVPAEQVRALVTRDPALGDLILRAYLARRSLLIGLGAGFRIIGSRYSADCRRLREFAARNRLPHRWIDLEEDETAGTLLRELRIPPEDTPVVIWRGDKVLRNPTVGELAKAIGLPAPVPGDRVRDLVIVGAGPAGLAAAVYGASEGLTTVVLDAVAAGGQAGTSSRIENYLGFPSGLSGAELAERAVIQAHKFGAALTIPAKATGLRPANGFYGVLLEDGDTVRGHAVIIATGARYRKLEVPELEKYEGSGVYYAATPFELRMCDRSPVVIVGGGNSAGQAALYLSKSASSVHMIVRGEDVRASMSRYLADELDRTPGIEIKHNTEVRELIGDGTLKGVRVYDKRAGEFLEIPTRAMFVFIGAVPHTDWLEGTVPLDDRGFVITGQSTAWNAQLPLESDHLGVFAVGDVRSGSVKRVASAVGEGAMAVRLVHERFTPGNRQRRP